MPIEFTCPNGHRLSTPVDHAGRMAKCPRCGAVTRVPELDGEGSRIIPADPAGASGKSGKLSGVGSGTAVTSDSAARKAASASGKEPLANGAKSSPAAAQPAQAAAEKPGDKPAASADATIVFLCPNGHKLNAPRTMQGHAGKCPHCGAKFRIPMLDDAASGEIDAGHVEMSTFQDIIGGAPAAAPAAAPGVYDHLTDVTAPAAKPQPQEELDVWDPDQHPLARLVIRLWSEREHGGIVEVHLNGGAILVPEWFDKKLSRHTHGLFAAQSADGTVTMTIVPWDTVSRVVVRGVVGLPDGLFE
jgi:hypothetical protein